ncbi:uncharacterized protein LOC143918990 [Arctopsyche grandis]|uniref:uncharacterized protein LOC143918990 n=1 Tax=Arctopsyche grandis TaxID=121162 RepID=UPI00406D798B
MATTLNKRKIDRERRTFKERWTVDYFFINKYGNPFCLICRESLSVLKEYNVRRHYETKHKEKFDSFNGSLRLSKICELITSLTIQNIEKAELPRPAENNHEEEVAEETVDKIKEEIMDEEDEANEYSQDIDIDEKPYPQFMREIEHVDIAHLPSTSSNTSTDFPNKQNSLIEVVLKPKTIELDDDYYFLMSLLPHFQTMAIKKKMMFRMKIKELMFGVMFDEQ